MKKQFNIIFFSLVIFGCGAEQEVQNFYKNNMAAQKINKKLQTKKPLNTDEAKKVQNLLQSTLTESFEEESVVYFNLGLSYELAGDTERARKSYGQSLLKAPSSQSKIRFLSHYNLGRLNGSEKKIDEALKEYQKALDIHPQSKEVKTNIELLLQKQSKSQKSDKQKEDQKKDNKDKKSNGNKQKEKNKQQSQGKNKKDEPRQPKEFKSKELSRKDVEKILEELKNQEQKIRAKNYNKKVKEKSNEKDW